MKVERFTLPCATGSASAPADDINVLALVKGEQRYVFLFDDHHFDAARRQFGEFASRPDLDFSWYDAAVLCKKLREVTHGR